MKSNINVSFAVSGNPTDQFRAIVKWYYRHHEMPQKLVKQRTNMREVYFFYTGNAIDERNYIDIETILGQCEVGLVVYFN